MQMPERFSLPTNMTLVPLSLNTNERPTLSLSRMYFPDGQSFENAMVAFANIQAERKLKMEIRAIIREIDIIVDGFLTMIDELQTNGDVSQIPIFCQKVNEKFCSIRPLYALIEEKVPAGYQYKYHKLWRYSTQRVLFVAALVVYFETEDLLDIERSAAFLGIRLNRPDSFHIDLTVFFLALLQMAEFLARFSAKVVIYGNYEWPRKIALFLAEIHSGFSQLNFKNDILRRKYDALKYHVKYASEISMDLRMHDLLPDQHSSQNDAYCYAEEDAIRHDFNDVLMSMSMGRLRI